MKASKQRGAVASENALATQAGLDILQIGGSAADAIIATQLCVGVIQSFVGHQLSKSVERSGVVPDGLPLDVRHWRRRFCVDSQAFRRL